MLLSTRGSCSPITKSKNICVHYTGITIVCHFHGSPYSTCWDIAALLSHSVHSLHCNPKGHAARRLKIELALWHQLKNLTILLT